MTDILRMRFAHRWTASALLVGVSVLPFVSTAASAQQDTAPAAASESDQTGDIIVTGSVLQNQAEITTRRNATAIVDTLSRDEIGALPDITIAESMRRITGVTTVYNDDIGQFASIRGVHPDYVPVTINGLAVATTGDLGEGTRKVNLQVIRGDAVRQLQAYKTPSPDLDAGALGGLLNLVTLSAFDRTDPRAFSLTAGVSYSSYMDVPDDNAGGDSKDSPFGKSLTASWSPRFGADESFGIVATGIYQVRPRTQSNAAIANRLYFNMKGAATTPVSSDWNGFAAPDSFVSHNYTNKFTLYGGTLRLEYRPSETFDTSLFGYAYFSDEQETRNTNRVYGLSNATNQTASTGTMVVRNSDVQWRYNTFERDQSGVQWLTNARISDRARLSANFGYSHAWFRSQRPYATFVYKPNTKLTYDLNDPERLFVLDNATAYTNGTNYKLTTIYDDTRETVEDVFEGRIDFTYNTGANDRGIGVALGANIRDLDISRDNSATHYKPGNMSLSGISFIPDFALPGYVYPGLWLDQATFWNRIVPTLAVDTATSNTQSRLSDYGYKERIYAGYATLNYTGEAFRIDAGLRLDHTSFDARMAQVIDGVLQVAQTQSSGSDTHLLPYLTARYSFSPDFRIKGAVSRTLGRPNPETMATVEQVNEDDLTITRGNPNIQPLRSTNYDLGLEYYFNGGQGMVTLTGFYKDITGDIVNLSSTQVIDGNSYIVTQPINGETTRYKGVELGFVNNSFGHIASWLAPVGASLNAVWIDGSTGYTYNGQHLRRDSLQFQSKLAGNAAIFYAFPGGSEIRFAANHQGRYVEEFAANPWQEIIIAPFTTFDLTAKWAVTPDIQLRLEGRNIFSANRKRLTGPGGDLFRAELEVGSSWFASVTLRL